MERRRREEDNRHKKKIVEMEQEKEERWRFPGGQRGLLFSVILLCGLLAFSGVLFLRVENEIGWEHIINEGEKKGLFAQMKEDFPPFLSSPSSSSSFSSFREEIQEMVDGVGKEEKGKWVINLGRGLSGLVEDQEDEMEEERVGGPISHFTPGRENSRRFSILRAKKPQHDKDINTDNTTTPLEPFDMLWNTYHTQPTNYLKNMEKDSIRCCVLPFEKKYFETMSRSFPTERAFSFLQIGGGAEFVGARVAAQYPKSTTLSIFGSLEEANGAENFISTYGAHNAYVINSPITRQLIRDFSVSVEVFDFIFIPDLTQWMEDLLPHEMEEIFRELFMLGREIWVSFPKNSEYFEAWARGGGAGRMLKEVGKGVSGAVEISDEGGGGYSMRKEKGYYDEREMKRVKVGAAVWRGGVKYGGEMVGLYGEGKEEMKRYLLFVEGVRKGDIEAALKEKEKEKVEGDEKGVGSWAITAHEKHLRELCLTRNGVEEEEREKKEKELCGSLSKSVLEGLFLTSLSPSQLTLQTLLSIGLPVSEEEGLKRGGALTPQSTARLYQSFQRLNIPFFSQNGEEIYDPSREVERGLWEKGGGGRGMIRCDKSVENSADLDVFGENLHFSRVSCLVTPSSLSSLSQSPSKPLSTLPPSSSLTFPTSSSSSSFLSSSSPSFSSPYSSSSSSSPPSSLPVSSSSSTSSSLPFPLSNQYVLAVSSFSSPSPSSAPSLSSTSSSHPSSSLSTSRSLLSLDLTRESRREKEKEKEREYLKEKELAIRAQSEVKSKLRNEVSTNPSTSLPSTPSLLPPGSTTPPLSSSSLSSTSSLPPGVSSSVAPFSTSSSSGSRTPSSLSSVYRSSKSTSSSSRANPFSASSSSPPFSLKTSGSSSTSPLLSHTSSSSLHPYSSSSSFGSSSTSAPHSRSSSSSLHSYSSPSSSISSTAPQTTLPPIPPPPPPLFQILSRTYAPPPPYPPSPPPPPPARYSFHSFSASSSTSSSPSAPLPSHLPPSSKHHFSYIWKTISPFLPSSSSLSSSPSLSFLVHPWGGMDAASLLPSKLASIFHEKGVVLSLSSSPLLLERTSPKPSNLFLCQSDLNRKVVNEVASSFDLFDYQFILDPFSSFFSSTKETFLKDLGQKIKLSHNSFLEFPPLDRLCHAFDLLSPVDRKGGEGCDLLEVLGLEGGVKDEKEAILTIVKEAIKQAGGVAEARVKILPLPSSGFSSSPSSSISPGSSLSSLSSLLSSSSLSSLISSLSLSLSKKCDGQMKRCFYDPSSLPTTEAREKEQEGEVKRVYGEGRVVLVEVRKMKRELMNIPLSSSSSSPSLLVVDKVKKGRGVYLEIGETGELVRLPPLSVSLFSLKKLGLLSTHHTSFFHSLLSLPPSRIVSPPFPHLLFVLPPLPSSPSLFFPFRVLDLYQIDGRGRARAGRERELPFIDTSPLVPSEKSDVIEVPDEVKALCEVVERAIVKGLDTKKKEGKVGEMEGVNHFSMLEHGSGLGFTSTLLGQWFPNATLVSLESDKHKVDSHYRLLEVAGVKNVIVGTSSSSPSTLQGLAASPEFFEYQISHHVFDMLTSEKSRSEVEEGIAYLLSLAIRTFLDVPSGMSISISSSLVMDPLPPLSEWEEKFLPSLHPTPDFKNFWARLLDTLPALGAQKVSVVSSSSRSVLQKEVVMINMEVLERKVNHHYKSELDGHQRKYYLHYKNEETYLTRAEDGSKIIYDNFGITLITLMRLSIPQSMTEKLYDQFLALPIYEDSAPWNIQYHAGVLRYVDKDSMDNTLDKYSSHLYQVILAFMNYERTVKDFGRCSQHVKGMAAPYVGHCVGSAVVDFSCPDQDKPVPCSDGQCHDTYMSCLKSVRKQEIFEGSQMGWRAKPKETLAVTNL